MTGPVFGHSILGALDNDLTVNFAAPGKSAIGPRIIVYGRVLDENARPVPDVLVEFWQANAGGRYRHKKDGYLAPLDPNFGGCGRTITDAEGNYSFRTIMPGAYPWPNGINDWRPAHIHFSVFGHSFVQRLITQMYFEGDPMIWRCPIVSTIPDRQAVEGLIAALDMEATVPMDARAYKFDIVLRGRPFDPVRKPHGGELMAQDLGPPEGKRLTDRRPLCAYRPDAEFPAASRVCIVTISAQRP